MWNWVNYIIDFWQGMMDVLMANGTINWVFGQSLGISGTPTVASWLVSVLSFITVLLVLKKTYEFFKYLYGVATVWKK